MACIPKAGFILIALAIASCAREDPPLLRILSSQPEIADYAAVYNLGRTRNIASVEYVTESQLGKALKEQAFDLAIAPRLFSVGGSSRFMSLDTVLAEGKLRRDAFYQQLLPAGAAGNAQRLLPISFNLSLAFFKKTAYSPSDPFLIELDALRASSAAFNIAKGKVFSRMGFSPRWEPEFLVLAAELMGADFSAASPLAWNSSGLREAYAFLRAWSAESNGGIEAENEFNFKYLYDPKVKLVLEGRVLFAVIDSDAYFVTPKEKRDLLGFRWISHKGRVIVEEDMLMAGILEGSAAREPAIEFLQWLLSPSTQELLLKRHREQGDMAWNFGFASGFSSIKEVSELSYPIHYPELIGAMPPASSMVLQKRLPPNWPILAERVIAPYLNEAIAMGAGIDENALAERVATWVKQNP
jgi:hypothetical protein